MWVPQEARGDGGQASCAAIVVNRSLQPGSGHERSPPQRSSAAGRPQPAQPKRPPRLPTRTRVARSPQGRAARVPRPAGLLREELRARWPGDDIRMVGRRERAV